MREGSHSNSELSDLSPTEHTGSKENSHSDMLAQLAREQRQAANNASPHLEQPKSDLKMLATVAENSDAYRRDIASPPPPITDFLQDMSRKGKRNAPSPGPFTSASDFTRSPEKRQRTNQQASSTMDVIRSTRQEQTNPRDTSPTLKKGKERETHLTDVNPEGNPEAPLAVTENPNVSRWQEVRDRYEVVVHPSNPDKEYSFSETWTRGPETPELLRAADLEAMMREKIEARLFERAHNALRGASKSNPGDADLRDALTSLNTFREKGKEGAAESLATQLHFTQLEHKITIAKYVNGKQHERIHPGDVIVTNILGKFGEDTSFRPYSIKAAGRNAKNSSKEYASRFASNIVA